jgi:hypothetical protein
MQSRKSATLDTETEETPTRAPFGQGPGNGQPFGRRQPTQQEIAKRAYEIYKSGKGGTEQENWYRAERELRAA